MVKLYRAYGEIDLSLFYDVVDDEVDDLTLPVGVNFVSYAENRIHVLRRLVEVHGDFPAYNYEFDNATKQWVFGALAEADYFYLPAKIEIAEQISRDLFELVSPNQTGKYCEVFDHPLGGANYMSILKIKTEDTVPINVKSNMSALTSTLQVSVDDGFLAQAEVDLLSQQLIDNAGSEVRLLDFVPASWVPYVMTETEVQALGYFN